MELLLLFGLLLGGCFIEEHGRACGNRLNMAVGGAMIVALGLIVGACFS